MEPPPHREENKEAERGVGAGEAAGADAAATAAAAPPAMHRPPCLGCMEEAVHTLVMATLPRLLPSSPVHTDVDLTLATQQLASMPVLLGILLAVPLQGGLLAVTHVDGGPWLVVSLLRIVLLHAAVLVVQLRWSRWTSWMMPAAHYALLLLLLTAVWRQPVPVWGWEAAFTAVLLPDVVVLALITAGNAWATTLSGAGEPAATAPPVAPGRWQLCALLTMAMCGCAVTGGLLLGAVASLWRAGSSTLLPWQWPFVWSAAVSLFRVQGPEAAGVAALATAALLPWLQLAATTTAAWRRGGREGGGDGAVWPGARTAVAVCTFVMVAAGATGLAVHGAARVVLGSRWLAWACGVVAGGVPLLLLDFASFLRLEQQRQQWFQQVEERAKEEAAAAQGGAADSDSDSGSGSDSDAEEAAEEAAGEAVEG